MGVKRDALVLALFFAFNIFLAFIGHIGVLFAIHTSLLLIVIWQRRLLGYIKLFYPLYLFSLVIIISNALFYDKVDGSVLEFSINGALYGAVIALRVLDVSTAAFVYRGFVSYYRLSCVFSASPILKSPLKAFSVMLILIFMFCDELKRQIAAYNISFSIRLGPRARHIIKYIRGLCLYIISSSLHFASSTASALSIRGIL